MANIEQDLQAIMQARYGKDVRQSIHDAIKDINDQEEGHVEVIEGYTEDAEAWAKGTKGGTPVESTDPTYHNNAKYYAESIGDTALISEEYAKGTKNGTPVVDGETGYHDNSKYYSEQASGSAQAALEQAQIAVQAAQSITGALKPKGTVTFANLPSVATADTGDMYNISTDFTTTSDFEEGAGVDYTKGTNVYLTSNGKWDVLAGLPIQYIGTRAEINAAVTAGIITEGMMIYCTDEEGPTDITALMVGYDNTSSGLSATSTQGAIDELKSDISTSITSLSNNKMDKSVMTVSDTSLIIRPDTENPSVALTAHLSGPTYNPRIAVDYLSADGTDTDNLSITYDGTNFTLIGTKAGVTKTATIPAT